MGKSMLRMGSCVRFCCHNILFLRTFPLVSALEFRCRRVILLANQKLTFDERISCITRHDDFSPRSDRTVSLQVAPFLGDCKGKGYRRRAGQTENEWVYRHQISLKWGFWYRKTSTNCLSAAFPYDPCRSMANNWHQYCKWILRMHRLSHSAWIQYHLIQ